MKLKKFLVLSLLCTTVVAALIFSFNAKAEVQDTGVFPTVVMKTSPNYAMYGHFGLKTIISEDGVWVATTAPGENNSKGYVHIYKNTDNATYYYQRLSENVPFGGTFGGNVSFSNNKLAISSVGYGSIYVYASDNNYWSKKATIQTPNQIGGMQILGDTIAVGFPESTNCGFVMIYKYVNNIWTATQTLMPAECNDFHNFGKSISLYGEYLAVGDVSQEGSNLQSSVKLYKLSNGSYIFNSELRSNDYAIGDYFGSVIVMKSDRIYIGAAKSITDNVEKGAVYVFGPSGSNWVQLQKISGSSNMSWFGATLAVANNVMIVGAPMETNTTGSVYVYIYNGQKWISLKKFVDSKQVSNTYFGYSVSLSDNNAFVVGAPGYDNKIPNDGAIFFYETVVPFQYGPANGGTVYGKPVVLSWETFNVGTYYQVKMKGKYISWQSSGVVKGSYDVSSFTFRAGEVYTWNVRACMDSKCIFASPWSTPSTFVWRPAYVTPSVTITATPTATPTTSVVPSGTTIPTPTARPSVD